jgi:hypothetical protein
LKPRTLSPRPDTRPMFQVSSAPLPVSRASASVSRSPPRIWTPRPDSRPGTPRSLHAPYPSLSPTQSKNGKIRRFGAFPRRLLHKSHESAANPPSSRPFWLHPNPNRSRSPSNVARPESRLPTIRRPTLVESRESAADSEAAFCDVQLEPQRKLQETRGGDQSDGLRASPSDLPVRVALRPSTFR